MQFFPWRYPCTLLWKRVRTIILEEGNYDYSDQHLTIDRTVTLKGAQAGVDARDRNEDESVIDFGEETKRMKIKAEDVVIDGLKITGAAGGTHEQAIRVKEDGITLRNNIIETESDVWAAIQPTANANSADNLTLEQNHFKTSHWGLDISCDTEERGAVRFYAESSHTDTVVTGNTVTDSYAAVQVREGELGWDLDDDVSIVDNDFLNNSVQVQDNSEDLEEEDLEWILNNNYFEPDAKVEVEDNEIVDQ